jgi:hypothetical protein
MRKLALLMVPLFLVGIGCSSQDGQNAAEKVAHEAEQAVDTAKSAVDDAVHHGPEGVAEGELVTLTGTLGCGHCTYHVGNSCAAAVKTSEGVVYILDKVGEDSELFQKRYDGTEITVVGVPSEQGGANHVAVASWQM